MEAVTPPMVLHAEPLDQKVRSVTAGVVKVVRLHVAVPAHDTAFSLQDASDNGATRSRPNQGFRAVCGRTRGACACRCCAFFAGGTNTTANVMPTTVELGERLRHGAATASFLIHETLCLPSSRSEPCFGLKLGRYPQGVLFPRIVKRALVGWRPAAAERDYSPPAGPGPVAGPQRTQRGDRQRAKVALRREVRARSSSRRYRSAGQPVDTQERGCKNLQPRFTRCWCLTLNGGVGAIRRRVVS